MEGLEELSWKHKLLAECEGAHKQLGYLVDHVAEMGNQMKKMAETMGRMEKEMEKMKAEMARIADEEDDEDKESGKGDETQTMEE